MFSGPLHSNYQSIKGLIFDCDGVIFDSLESNKVYYNAILERLGLGPMTPEEENYVHSHTVWESLEHIVPPFKRNELDQARASVDYYKEILPYLKPESGVYEILSWLRSQGIRLGVSTNRTTTMDRVAEVYGLKKYFDPIVAADKVKGKPHPEGVYFILRKWGLEKKDVVYIGDSSVDQNTAMAAGVAFWSYKNPYLRACLHIKDFWGLRLRLQSGWGDGGW